MLFDVRTEVPKFSLVLPDVISCRSIFRLVNIFFYSTNFAMTKLIINIFL